MSEDELFDILIIEPFLYEIDGEREPLLIVLDGIDEMTSTGDNALARLIAKKAPSLPRFVHFVVASRKDSVVLRYNSGAHLIELLPSEKNVREDIQHYLEDRLEALPSADSASVSKGQIAQIADVCEGSFLLASLIAGGIRQGVLRLEDKMIPPDVDSIYFEWMSRLVTGEEFEENYYEAFAILASLDKPVTVPLFREALGWNAQKFNGFVRRFRSFLMEEKDSYNEKCLTLYHKSFRSWLTDEDGAADVYTVAMEDGHELVGSGALSLWTKNRLPEGEIPYLKAYLTLADMADELDQLQQSDSYLNALINIARDAAEKRQRYAEAERILQQCEDICKKRKASDYILHIRDAVIPMLRVSSYYDAGDFVYVREMLIQLLPGILASGSPEDIMQSLYMLGTSCDLLGERTRSVEYFDKLKQEAEKAGSAFYRNRALVGLAWNRHFSDISGMNELFAELEQALDGEWDREKALLYMVTARSLMARGEVARALKLFSVALENAEADVWGYGHLAIRSQMLLIETLVACYDNQEFDLGIRYGLDIYDHLSGRSSIAECYCASWLANIYLANGKPDLADAYLKRAEALNSEANGSSSSAWMNMHLTSIRGFWLAEKGEYEDAFRHHKAVAKMAVECADLWVLGDALFEMILLTVFTEAGSAEETVSLSNELETTAEKSGLPHLQFKSSLVKAVISSHTGNEKLKEITDLVMDNSLAATDMVVCGDICRRIAVREKNEEAASLMAEFIISEIRRISGKNPGGAYGLRKRIINIQESLKN